MKVAVGSRNPAKVSAVKEAFTEQFGEEPEVISLSIDSKVSNQPLKRDTINGAYNRAKGALEATGADYGVGIEGGLMKLGDRWYALGFVVIVDRLGNKGTGTSGWFECPKIILQEIEKGKELGDVADKISGRKLAKEEGAIGFLTRNHVSRKDLYRHGVYMALVPLMNKELWR